MCLFRGHSPDNDVCDEFDENRRIFDKSCHEGWLTRESKNSFLGAACSFFPVLTSSEARQLQAWEYKETWPEQSVVEICKDIEEAREIENRKRGYEPYATETACRRALDDAEISQKRTLARARFYSSRQSVRLTVKEATPDEIGSRAVMANNMARVDEGDPLLLNSMGPPKAPLSETHPHLYGLKIRSTGTKKELSKEAKEHFKKLLNLDI